MAGLQMGIDIAFSIIPAVVGLRYPPYHQREGKTYIDRTDFRQIALERNSHPARCGRVPTHNPVLSREKKPLDLLKNEQLGGQIRGRGCRCSHFQIRLMANPNITHCDPIIIYPCSGNITPSHGHHLEKLIRCATSPTGNDFFQKASLALHWVVPHHPLYVPWTG